MKKRGSDLDISEQHTTANYSRRAYARASSVYFRFISYVDNFNYSTLYPTNSEELEDGEEVEESKAIKGLKNHLKQEIASYEKSEKIFCLSDIYYRAVHPLNKEGRENPEKLKNRFVLATKIILPMLFNSKDGLLIDEKGNLVSGKVMFDENGEFSTFRSFFCSFSKKYFSEKEDVSLLHLLTGESSSKGDFIKNVIEFKEKFGSTILIDAFADKHTEVAGLIFKEIGKLSEDSRLKLLKKVLTQRDNQGFTPVINACKNKDSKAAELIFKEIGKISESGRLRLLKKVLTQQDNQGFTPVISACKGEDSKAAELIFKEIGGLAEDRRLELLKEVLTQQDSLGFTPVISACKNKNSKAAELIFKEIGELPESGRLELLKEVLIQQDNHGFTPAIEACVNTNYETVKLIFEAINEIAKSNKKDAIDILKTVLTQKDLKETTLLNIFCLRKESDSLPKESDMIHLVFDKIGKIFPKEDISQFVINILKEKNKRGFSAFSNALGKDESLYAVAKGILFLDLDINERTNLVLSLVESSSPPLTEAQKEKIFESTNSGTTFPSPEPNNHTKPISTNKFSSPRSGDNERK